MRVEWSILGKTNPTALVGARTLAHRAAQWATRAARANLEAAADDSHSSLRWNAEHAWLESQPLATHAGEVRIGIRVADLVLVVVRGGGGLANFTLAGATDAAAGAWIDARLGEVGLKPAGGVKLPYTIPDHSAAAGAGYAVAGATDALAELSCWYAAAAAALENFRAKLAGLSPGPGAVRCWPHHFDIATLVRLEQGDPETARSVGVGFSPGDDFYAQPYFYVSPWPRLDSVGLPDIPAPGHWHTQGFVGAVATGEAILAQKDRADVVAAFITRAFDISRSRLKI